MKAKAGLKSRFALWTGALFFGALLALSISAYGTLRIFLHRTTQDALRAEAEGTASSLRVEAGRIVVPESLKSRAATAPSTGGSLSVRLVTPEGELLFSGGPLAPFLPAPGSAREKYSFFKDNDLNVYSIPFERDGRVLAVVQVAKSTEGHEDALRELAAIFALGLLLFVPASAAAGYYLASILLRPIDEMTRTARRFSEADLGERLGLPDTGDELGRLAATFDEMLGRIESSFMRYRRFTADASHELRTPLSVMDSIISVTRQRRRSAEEYESALDDLRSETRRMGVLVNDLLDLSRLDGDDAPRRGRVDLSSVVEEVAAALSPLAEAKGLRLELDAEPGLAAEGDREELARALLNVAGNAIKFTQGGSVRMSARAAESGSRIEVRDTGVGIAAEALPFVFDRFFRAEESRTSEGSGLGLAIAKAIIQRHGGKIGIESAKGEGSLVRIELPAFPSRS